MSLNEELDMLRKIRLFSKVEPAKLKLLAFTSERAVFEAEEAVPSGLLLGGCGLHHRRGRGGCGCKAVDVESTSGGRTRVAWMGRDQIVGEIGILGDVPRTATVTALGRTTTLKITKDLFIRMVSDFPTMAVEAMRVLAHRVEHINAVLRECQDKLAVADRA